MLRYFICLLLIFAACSKPGQEQDGQGGHKDAGDQAVAVEVVALETGPLENALLFSANLEAEVQVQVLSRTSGQVMKMLVEEGDAVSKNQVLLRLGDAEERSALKRASAELGHAKKAFARQEKLQSQGVVSDNEREQAQFDLRRLQIAYSDAKRHLAYTVIRTAVAGTVTLRKVKFGDFVNPNQHLFDVTDFRSIVAKVFIPEKEVSSVQVGQTVRIFSPSSPQRKKEGHVLRIAPVVDPRSGTTKVVVEVTDTSGLQPGAFISVELVTSENPKAVLLPRKAMVYDNDIAYVFKLGTDGRVKRVAVETKLAGKLYVEAASGFSEGDKIVVAGQVGLKDKARVDAKVIALPKK